MSVSLVLPSDRTFWERRGRFLDKWYQKAPGCWEWTGTKNRYGYGICTFAVAGRVTSSLAHRLQYQRYNGPIAANLVVMHTCDNPACMNPDHLVVGTQAENIADMMAKGRHATQAKWSVPLPSPPPEPPPVLSEWQKAEWRKRHA